MQELKLGGDLYAARLAPRSGEGPRILFIHGLWAWHYVWERWQHLFADYGYDTYAISLRGHAGSRPVARLGEVSLLDYVADVQEAAEAVQADILVGHSMGGLIVQKALEGEALPTVKAAVLVTPAAPRGILSTGNLSILFRQLKYLPDLLQNRPFRPSFEDARALAYSNLPLSEARLHFNRSVPDSGRVCREISLGAVAVDETSIRVPMLVLVGARDRLTPVNVVSKIAAKYHADYRVYARHGHMLNCEEGWETPARDTLEWVAARVPPKKSSP